MYVRSCIQDTAMPTDTTTPTDNRRTKVVRVGLRATPEQEALIRRAATATHKSVTEFMLNSACAAAEETLLNRVLFPTNEKAWQKFSDALQRPAKVNSQLKRLLAKKPAW